MFLGREEELGELGGALEESLCGRGRVSLVSGDPGIGKTAVARRIAGRAEEAGARVVWARCREEGGAPVHWPWVQIVRALAEANEPERLGRTMGRGAAYIATAIPDVRERLPEDLRREALVAAPDQFAFFDAVETFLRQLSGETPLVLVFDDLHAADGSSLSLLEFVAAEIGRSRILVLATYREYEAETGDAGPTIARIARHGHRVRLRGLPMPAIADLVAEIAGRRVSGQLISAIQSATDGSPLFVHEITRSLHAAGKLDEAARFDLPPSVQHVIAARVEDLSEATKDVLSAAAVIGRSFDVGMVSKVSAVPVARIVAALEEAFAADIVTIGGGVKNETSFAHAVYREFFYGGLSLSRRAELHRDAAVALEERNADLHVAAIAFHFLEAGPLGDPARAIDYSLRAGDQAMARMAFSQAIGHYAEAMRAGELGPRDDATRCDLWLRIAEARFRAGEAELSKVGYRDAAAVARASRDGPRLARAALGIAGPWPHSGGIVRDEVVQILEEALRLLGPEEKALRAMLLARLATDGFGVTTKPSLEASDRALSLARRARDPRALGHALLARRWARQTGPHADSLEKRLALAQEAARIAHRLGDVDLGFRSRFDVIMDLCQLGDVHQLDAEISAAAHLAERLNQPFYLWFVSAWRAMRALLDGRLADAERMIGDALATAQRVQGREDIQQFGVQTYFTQLYHVRLQQGGQALADLEPMWRDMAERIAAPIMRCALALLHCELERTTEARDEVERLAASEFAAIRDTTEVACLAALAGVVADLRDRGHAEVLYTRALPHAAEHVSNGAYYFGPMAHHLGRLAATIGRTADAVGHYEGALRAERNMGARCWIARTQYHYGELLLATKEEAQGTALLAEASSRARHLGMISLSTKLERSSEGTRRVVPAAPTPYLIRRQGEFWTIVFEGRTFQLKDQKGLRFLAFLLAHPGRRVHVSELLALEDETRADAEGLEVFDRQAMKEYRDRLRDLRAELDEAAGHNDIGTAERIRGEIEFLEAELKRAVGLGGRTRKTGSSSERARLNVSRAIHNVTAKLAKLCPPLDLHLKRTLRTGTYCGYDPDPASPVTWEV